MSQSSENDRCFICHFLSEIISKIWFCEIGRYFMTSNKGQEKLWFDQDDMSSGRVFQAGRKSATTPSFQLPKFSEGLICLFKGIAFCWKKMTKCHIIYSLLFHRYSDVQWHKTSALVFPKALVCSAYYPWVSPFTTGRSSY